MKKKKRKMYWEVYIITAKYYNTHIYKHINSYRFFMEEMGTSII